MKELVEKNKIRMNNGIEVAPYLTYDQIEAIAREVCKFDTWSEREASIDIMVLHFSTNLTNKEIEEIGHDTFVKSGVMFQIRNNIANFNKIYEAIEYTESTRRALAQILKELPEIMKPLREAIENAPSKK